MEDLFCDREEEVEIKFRTRQFEARSLKLYLGVLLEWHLLAESHEICYLKIPSSSFSSDLLYLFERQSARLREEEILHR